MLKIISLRLLTVLQVSFCTVALGWLIYLRLFRWGSFREVATNLLFTENYFRLGLLVYIIICLVIALILQFRELYSIESKLKLTIFNTFIQFWEDTFDKFFNFLNKLAYSIGMRQEGLLQFGLHLGRVFNTSTKRNILIYSIYVLPRLIYSIVFIIDTFIFRQLYYVFMFSGLLLIPFFIKHLEKLFQFIIEDTYDVLEGIFYIFDEDSKACHSLRDYFWIGFFADLDGEKHPIQNYELEFQHAYVFRQMTHAESLGKSMDMEKSMERHSTAYFEIYYPLQYFYTYYRKSKMNIKRYADILFTISHLIIWSSLLFMTL